MRYKNNDNVMKQLLVHASAVRDIDYLERVAPQATLASFVLFKLLIEVLNISTYAQLKHELIVL